MRAVDADRLIAWQLYWRGENFWSGDEIFGWLPEMKTGVHQDRQRRFHEVPRTIARARRSAAATSWSPRPAARRRVRSMLPTQRARDTFEVIDTTSNKFSMVAFYAVDRGTRRRLTSCITLGFAVPRLVVPQEAASLG